MLQSKQSDVVFNDSNPAVWRTVQRCQASTLVYCTMLPSKSNAQYCTPLPSQQSGVLSKLFKPISVAYCATMPSQQFAVLSEQRYQANTLAYCTKYDQHSCVLCNITEPAVRRTVQRYQASSLAYCAMLPSQQSGVLCNVTKPAVWRTVQRY